MKTLASPFLACVAAVSADVSSCQQGTCHDESGEDAALLQLRRRHQVLIESDPDHVKCQDTNSSNTQTCIANQCCSGTEDTGGRTYPCPSNWSYQHCEIKFTSKRGGCWAVDSDEVLCRRNQVSVFSLKSRNARRLRFGEDCAIETEVRCKGPRPANCSGVCGDCPCDFDPSGQLTSSYQRTMYEKVEPVCAAGTESRMLMIGLGGGEMVQYFLERCPKMSIDAVELNGDVIAVARQYFGLGNAERNHKGRVSLEQADAMSALSKKGTGLYDFVLVDCFQGKGEVPETCRSRKFAEAVRYTLKSRGVMLQNMWGRSPQLATVSQEYHDTVAVYNDVFEGGFQDVHVPMPQAVDFVHVLKGEAP